MRRVPLRAGVALLCAGTVAAAIIAASVVAWIVTKHTMLEQIDESLSGRPLRADALEEMPGQSGDWSPEDLCDGPASAFASNESAPRMQLIRADGTGCSPLEPEDQVEPTEAERAVARGERESVLRNATSVGGERMRTFTTQVEDGYALRLSRSLGEHDATLRQLAWTLGGVAALGVLVAGGAGLAVARLALRPVDELTAAAEHIAATEDLDVPIEVRGRDEVARLSRAFNAMTARLAGSRTRLQRLIADTGHELRTPLTSLRTNLEWLMRSEDRGTPMTPRQRRQVEQAVLGQIDELSTLIGELGALARDEHARDPGPLDLDQVVLRAVERAQLRDPARRFELEIAPWPVVGDAEILERAVLNLLDNALKFSEGVIAVSLADGRVTITDRGPGLSAEEREQAFERFWRAPSARELPGSGLGLAIVADAADRHGGRVFFIRAPGGGSRVGFEIPADPSRNSQAAL